MYDMKQDKDSEDPAQSHPWKRFIVRGFVTQLFIYLSIIIPGLVFFLVSILIGASFVIGILLAFISFVVYIYILCKKELWNKIRR